MNLLPEAMPAERQANIIQIASVLWNVAWRFEGGIGTSPPFDTLSERNKRRWIGAALATEHLISQAKQDSVQQSVVINGCIAQLEKYRDENAEVHIK